MSVNGIIATPDGKEDFLSHDNWLIFSDHVNKVGCLIWGHNTYKQVINWPDEYLNSLDTAVKVIISKDPNLKLDPRFVLANSPEQALSLLHTAGFESVILTGGSTNNSEFAKRGLINEVLLTVDTVIIGTGIPLFKPDNFEMKLELIDVVKETNSLVKLRYRVL